MLPHEPEIGNDGPVVADRIGQRAVADAPQGVVAEDVVDAQHSAQGTERAAVAAAGSSESDQWGVRCGVGGI